MTEREITWEEYDPANAEEVEFLDDRNWFVRGGLNEIIGPPKIGKGTLASTVINWARRGMLNTDGPCSVGIIGREDSFRKVWTPRMKAAGVPKGKVYILRMLQGQSISLTLDWDELIRVVDKLNLRVVILDALLDNLSMITDAHKSQDVRKDLEPLNNFGEKNDCTFLGFKHPNNQGITLTSWHGGSNAFLQVPRSIVAVCPHPEDPRYRVVAAMGNYASEAESARFRIVSKKVGVRNPRTGRWTIKTYGKVANIEPCGLTIHDLIAGKRETRRGNLDRLLINLTANGGMNGTEVLAKCKEKGYGEKIVRNHKSLLGILDDGRGWWGSSRAYR